MYNVHMKTLSLMFFGLWIFFIVGASRVNELGAEHAELSVGLVLVSSPMLAIAFGFLLLADRRERGAK